MVKILGDKKKKELPQQQQVEYLWMELTYYILYLIVTIHALIYVLFLLALILRFTSKENVEKMKELKLGW